MAIERQSGGTSLIDVRDRVLSKGAVVGGWIELAVAPVVTEVKAVVSEEPLTLSGKLEDGGPSDSTPLPVADAAGRADTQPRAVPPRQRRPID